MTPQAFFSKNIKWFTLAFCLLFLFQCTKTCNRNTQLKNYKQELEMVTSHNQSDIISINAEYVDYRKKMEDSVSKLRFNYELERERRLSAEQTARSLEIAIQNFRQNTTITVRTNEDKNN